MEKQRCLALQRHRITLSLHWSTVSIELTTWNKINTHMKRQRCLTLCGRRITPFGKLYWWKKAKLMQLMQFYIYKINTRKTHMKRQHCLALGRHRITLFGQLYRGSQLHETNAIFMQWMQFYICKIKHIQFTPYLALGWHIITLYPTTISSFLLPLKFTLTLRILNHIW